MKNSGKNIPNKMFDTSKFDDDEITIKSAKGMTNLADFIKHNGLVKISGPKRAAYLRSGEIDVLEESEDNR